LVYGVDAAITFDPSKVHVVGIARNTSAFPNNDYELQNVFDNTGGTAVISVITGIISPPTINSATTIATFTFQAVGPGDISISFDEDRTIAIASGEGSSNVITASTPAQVVISGTTYNSDDFADLAAHWLSTGSGLAADVNADSAVNARDLGVMMSFWED
ncbi:MAG: hypothetical protein QG620_830, partial [Patescibacteria group bacterium]|nr:hypothetical protein [Patescibacteria group bacterium]